MSHSKRNLLPGNLIPNEWYKRFVDADGPDLVCITLLSEIVALYRFGYNIYKSKNPSAPQFVDGALSLSYEYFEEKFGFSGERARRALVRLEKAGVLKRDVRNIQTSSGKRINRLIIILDPVFFESCFRDSKPDKKVEPRDKIKNSNNSDDLVINSADSGASAPPPCAYGHPIKKGKNNNKENRSIASAKSSFLKKSSNSSLKKNAPKETTTNHPQGLKDFYPLSEQDHNKLQTLSGRDFSLRAMNEILLDMSQRLERWFKGKKSFLSYMSKAFKYEMRDAVKTAGETFYIKNNLKIHDASVQERITETLEIKKQEKYLTEIEYSLEVSPEWHLKKKLASVLERGKAYNLLTSYVSGSLKDDGFTLTLSKPVDLSPMDRKIILDQIKATHERGDFASGEFSLVDRLEVLMPEYERDKNPVKQGVRSAETGMENNSLKGIWGKVRKSIASYYGQKGQGIDKAWFSKLEPEIDEERRIVKLKAPTNFIRDWITREYGNDIEKFLKHENYQCLLY